MNILSSKICAGALSIIASAGYCHASLAGETSLSFKPLQALTFDAGHKRAVGYFTADADTCRLVLTLADDQAGASDTFQATRYEVTIPADRSSRYSSDGHIFEFGCAQHAEEITMKDLSTLASVEAR